MKGAIKKAALVDGAVADDGSTIAWVMQVSADQGIAFESTYEEFSHVVLRLNEMNTAAHIRRRKATGAIQPQLLVAKSIAAEPNIGGHGVATMFQCEGSNTVYGFAISSEAARELAVALQTAADEADTQLLKPRN